MDIYTCFFYFLLFLNLIFTKFTISQSIFTAIQGGFNLSILLEKSHYTSTTICSNNTNVTFNTYTVWSVPTEICFCFVVFTCISLLLYLGRRSLHHFDNPEEEDSSLIYNYTPVYAGNFTGYEQLYFF